MANDLRKNIVDVLQQCKQEIQANMSAKGINASGRTSRAFAVKEGADNVSLVLGAGESVSIPCKPRGVGSVQVGIAPLDTLEIGRPAGKVPRGFYYIIKQWTRDKGLSFGSEGERQTFAYFLSRKIAREGTKRYKQHEDVWSTPVNKARESLRTDIRVAIAAQVHSIVTNFK